MTAQRIRHAGVVGSPISHSRSPQLHLAAYRELGLTRWTYDRIECGADDFARLVDSLDSDWVGLSVTMPNKVAALRVADRPTERAVLVGAANTLVRDAQGWSADCTDIDGVIGALGDAGISAVDGPAVIVGAGGTARAAVAAVAAMGASEVELVVRDPARAQDALGTAAALSLPARTIPVEELRAAVHRSAAVISTVPRGGLDTVAADVAAAPVLLDAIYHPWPTPIAEAVSAAGGRVVGGYDMLLHQAVTQVELFTGLSAPVDAMRAALAQSADA